MLQQIDRVINQPVTDDPAYLEGLQREVRLAARLSHRGSISRGNRYYSLRVYGQSEFI